jgi:hypothetical protein
LGALLADHPDYAEDPTALKEICGNIDDLNYKLWKVIERKKDEAAHEREERMASRTLKPQVVAWIRKEITNALTAGNDIMQYELNKFVDASYYLVSCSHFLAGFGLPRLFDERVLHFDPSLVGEEPYSILERLHQEAAQFVSQAGTGLSSLQTTPPSFVPSAPNPASAKP